MLDNTDLTKTL
jgi:hypothetical protein